MIITNKELKHPIIVLTGQYGSGKSYAAKVIKRDLNVAVNLNKYDFITRQLMYICDINPAKTEYNWINSDKMDYYVMVDPSNAHVLQYIKDSVFIKKGIDSEIIAYILQHLFNCTNVNLQNLTDNTDLQTYMATFNMMQDNRLYADMTLLYKLTIGFFDLLLSQYYDFSNKLDVYKYLDNVMQPYKTIQEKNAHRVIYYAYTINEVEYFREKYNAPVIYISMDHVIRTNTLSARDEFEKLEKLYDESHVEEMAAIKNLSTAIVKNDFDFDTIIGNKIKYVIDFE